MLDRRAFLATSLLIQSIAAEASAYPERPIRVLHGFNAGGPPDLALRRIAVGLQRELQQPLVVQNTPGASGMIAAGNVLRATADGYTLLFGVAANLCTGPAVHAHPPYDPRDFTAIAQVARGPYVWLVRSDNPAQSMQDFVAWAKGRPGKVNYASPGIGSMHHLATLQLDQLTGMQMVHVPYSATKMYDGLLSGQVDAMFDSLPGPLPHIHAGKVRALGVSGTQRLEAQPEVPTLQEQGIALVASSWWGFVGPKRLEPSIVQRLNASVQSALDGQEVREALHAMGIAVAHAGPAEFGDFIAAEYLRWRQLVSASGLKID